MSLLYDILRLGFGGLLLYIGADWLVRGAAGLARSFGISPLIVGLTVVAYGTSAPELAVSISAILDDASPLVLGNVIGSNIANLGLILGLTAIIKPPGVDGRLIRREIPVLVLATAAVPLALGGGGISFLEALLLTGCALAFTIYTLSTATADDNDVRPAAPPVTAEPAAAGSEEPLGRLALGGLTVLGLATLIGAGELFVTGARGIALAMGMSERTVGLTVVAVGTSLPELAASLVAASRGHSSLAVGNVIGSNIFNVFLILGIVGIVRPIRGDLSSMVFDLAFLGGITVVGILFMRGSRRVSRIEGVVLLVSYVAFVTIAATT